MMKAISIRQPWAWLIVNGHKRIENRTWQTHHRGPILIHAAGKIAPGFARKSFNDYRPYTRDIMLPITFDKGGIVAIATLVDVVRSSTSPWFEGPFGWVFDDIRPMKFTPMPGQQGLFDVEPAKLIIG